MGSRHGTGDLGICTLLSLYHVHRKAAQGREAFCLRTECGGVGKHLTSRISHTFVINLYSINLESGVESGTDALILLSPNFLPPPLPGQSFFLKQSDSLT